MTTETSKESLPAFLTREGSANLLWNQIMTNQEFRKFTKDHHKSSPLMEDSDSDNEEENDSKEKENKGSKFSEKAIWKIISWFARARASVRLKKFRSVQEKLDKDLRNYLFHDMITEEDHKSSKQILLGPITLKKVGDDIILEENNENDNKFEIGSDKLLQVNRNLYTIENLYNRLHLSSHKVIIFRILQWWKSIRKDLKNLKKDPFGTISKEDYTNLLICIYKIMVPDGNSKHMKKTIQSDWEADSKGKDHINVEDFVSALFELSDIWTNSCEMEEYEAFLRVLHLHVLKKSKKLGFDFMSDFEDKEFDPLDSILQGYIIRVTHPNDYLLNEGDNKPKKKKVNSSTKVNSSIGDYFNEMMKIKKGNLKFASEDQKLKLLFAAFDTNQDGVITLNELKIATRIVRGHRLKKKELLRLINEADENGDGVISFDEFVNIMKSREVEN